LANDFEPLANVRVEVGAIASRYTARPWLARMRSISH
jgi:hypothetical protein